MNWPRSRSPVLVAEVEASSPPVDDVQARVFLNVTTASGSAEVEFRIRVATLEVWHHQLMIGGFDRRKLAAWFDEPFQLLTGGAVTFGLDRALDIRGDIALTLPDLRDWVLNPTVLSTLQRELKKPARLSISTTRSPRTPPDDG